MRREFVISADEKAYSKPVAASSRRWLQAPVVPPRVEHEYFRKAAWNAIWPRGTWHRPRCSAAAKENRHCSGRSLLGKSRAETKPSARYAFLESWTAVRAIAAKSVDRSALAMAQTWSSCTPRHASWLNQIEILLLHCSEEGTHAQRLRNPSMKSRTALLASGRRYEEPLLPQWTFTSQD